MTEDYVLFERNDAPAWMLINQNWCVKQVQDKRAGYQPGSRTLLKVTATNAITNEVLKFDSVNDCAEYFSVGNSAIYFANKSKGFMRGKWLITFNE